MDNHPPPRLIDWESALEAVGGDQNLLADIVAAYCREAPRQWDLLVVAVQNSDAVAARRAAHTLKGNSRYFGARQLVELAQSIEERAQRGELSMLSEQTDRLREALNLVLSAMTDCPYNNKQGNSDVDHHDR